MINIRTAILIPTYNRSNVIKDTLLACLQRYKKFNFDVYIFDSSSDDKTQNIVEKLQQQYNNLFYIRLSEFIHLDCKWLDMIRGKYLTKNYDYYYPCGDANSLTTFTLERIMPYLEKKVDLINLCDSKKINKTSIFTNADDFFNSENMNISQWGGAIYNKNTFFNLTEKQWNQAILKWFSLDKEYIGLNGFLLERLSFIKDLKIVEPSMDGAEPYIVLRRSRFKKESFWRCDAIKLLGVTYPKVYNNLPKCYSNIQLKLQKLLYDNFSEQYFFYLKRKYKFNFSDYLKFKRIFKEQKVKILNKKIFLLSILPNNKFVIDLLNNINK